MCNTNAIIGLQVMGAVNQAAGAYTKAATEKNTLNAEAGIADLNAELSQRAAKAAYQQGQLEEQQSRARTTQTKDSQVTATAANGIDLSSETAIRLATTTDVMGDIEANIINVNAARAAWGYKMEGVQYANEARSKRATASTIKPGMAAMTSLVGSAGNIAESYVRLKTYEDKNPTEKTGRTGRGTGK